jgi:predicted Fe-S protein YdhL (DUF1289 family)
VATEETFQEGVMRALWERLNQQKWMRSKDDEREYVLQAFQGDVEMPDQSEDEDDAEDGQDQGTGRLNSVKAS